MMPVFEYFFHWEILEVSVPFDIEDQVLGILVDIIDIRADSLWDRIGLQLYRKRSTRNEHSRVIVLIAGCFTVRSPSACFSKRVVVLSL
jgi:hypothetical protein